MLPGASCIFSLEQVSGAAASVVDTDLHPVTTTYIRVDEPRPGEAKQLVRDRGHSAAPSMGHLPANPGL